MKVTVIYALADEQFQVELQVPPGCTAEQALEQSGILQRYPLIDLTQQPIGIYGRKVALDQVLAAGDRVEIYRPLQIDPRRARLARVKAERQA